jgi:hypothetical protein
LREREREPVPPRRKNNGLRDAKIQVLINGGKLVLGTTRETKPWYMVSMSEHKEVAKVGPILAGVGKRR